MLGRYKDLGVYFIALADREQHVRQFAREKLGVGELDIIGEGAHIPKLPLGFLQVQGEVRVKLFIVCFWVAKMFFPPRYTASFLSIR